MSALHLWNSVHAKIGYYLMTRVEGERFFLPPVKTNSGAKRDSCPKGGGIYEGVLISP